MKCGYFKFFEADIHLQGFAWQTEDIRYSGKIHFYDS